MKTGFRIAQTPAHAVLLRADGQPWQYPYDHAICSLLIEVTAQGLLADAHADTPEKPLN